MNREKLKRILYVEDDNDIRTVAQIALETVGGFALEVCSSGREALDAVKSGFLPDLILLDVMMPEMNGPTALKSLRMLGPTAETPVIFMTAKVQNSEVVHYLSLGALGVIPKPFDPMQLAEQIRKLWEAGDGDRK